MGTNESKQVSFQDTLELYRNLARILVIVLYTPLIFFIFTSEPSQIGEFLHLFMSWPPGRYFFFFFPLGLLLVNMYLFSVERRTHVPIPRVSRNFIYLSGIVTLLFYASFIGRYFQSL